MKKEEKEKKDYKTEIKEKIDFLNKKTLITDKDVYKISKEFFYRLLNIDYEMTSEELLEELNKNYIEKEAIKHCEHILTTIKEIESLSKEHNKNDLRKLLDELKGLLYLLGEEDTTQKNLVEKIKQELHIRTFTKEEKTGINNLKAKIKNLKQETDFKKKKEKYIEINSIYDKLDEEIKIHFYNQILKIYHQLKKEEKDNLVSKVSNSKKNKNTLRNKETTKEKTNKKKQTRKTTTKNTKKTTTNTKKSSTTKNTKKKQTRKTTKKTTTKNTKKKEIEELKNQKPKTRSKKSSTTKNTKKKQTRKTTKKTTTKNTKKNNKENNNKKHKKIFNEKKHKKAINFSTNQIKTN